MMRVREFDFPQGIKPNVETISSGTRRSADPHHDYSKRQQGCGNARPPATRNGRAGKGACYRASEGQGFDHLQTRHHKAEMRIETDRHPKISEPEDPQDANRHAELSHFASMHNDD